MKYTFIFLLAMLAIPALAQDPQLEKMRANYDRLRQEHIDEREKATASLIENFDKAADRVLEQARQVGDLDLWLALKEERAGIRDAGIARIDTESASPALAKLKGSLIRNYGSIQKAYAQKQGKLVQQYEAALTNLQKKRVMDDQIDAAVAVKTELQQLQSEPDYALSRPEKKTSTKRPANWLARPGSGWPSNKTGLIWLWEHAKAANSVVDLKTRRTTKCDGNLRGQATFGQRNEMVLGMGAFVTKDVDERLQEACQKSNELTIETRIYPGNVTQSGPARIISFSTDGSSRNFTLGQEKDQLDLRIRTPKTGSNGSFSNSSMGRMKEKTWHHVVVSYKRGKLVCYIDGEETYSSETDLGDFSNWSKQKLLLGDEYREPRDWNGSLEGIAIYSRFMESTEAKLHYRLVKPKMPTR